MKSSFVRKAPTKRQCPPGTKLSVHNGQLLVSSGLHDFDDILISFLIISKVNSFEYAKKFLVEGLQLVLCFF